MCSGSENFVPSKTVNVTIHKVSSKLNFDSGLCQFSLKFFSSFMYSEVVLIHDKTDATVSFPVNCLSLQRAFFFPVNALYTKAYFSLC